MGSTGKIFVLVFYLLCVYIFVQTYLYLDEIDRCPCFHKDGKYAVSIDFMKFFQVLEIVILTASLGTMFFLKSKAKVDVKKAQAPTIILSLTVIIMLIISAFMAYNVINMYTNIKDDCKCVDSWYRYFLYYEGFVSLITVFRFVLVFLLVGIFFIMSKLK